MRAPLVFWLRHVLLHLPALLLLLRRCLGLGDLFQLFERQIEILDEPDALVVLQVLEADRLEREPTLDVEFGSLPVLTCFEVDVSLVGRDLGLLLCGTAVFESRVDLAIFEEVLPGVLVFALKGGNRDLFFVREAK